MSSPNDSFDPRVPDAGSHSSHSGPLPSDIAALGGMLEKRGVAHRSALSGEGLERIAAMSELHLPVADGSPVVIARIGAAESGSTRLWRAVAIAAAVVATIGIGIVLVRGAGDSGDPSSKSGVLADGSAPVGSGRSAASPELPAAPAAAQRFAPEHVERALASSTVSASAVVVAMSGAAGVHAVDADELRLHGLDETLAADFAPILGNASFLDGAGITYEDLSSEFAAIVAPPAFR